MTLGAGAETVTVVDCCAEPPALVQVSVNFVVAVRSPVRKDPLVGSLPLQPPEAVQVSAWVAAQVSVEVAPFLMVLGFAVKEVITGAAAVTVTWVV